MLALGDDEEAGTSFQLTKASAQFAQDTACREAIRDAVLEALAGLTRLQQQVVRHYYLEGYDYRETAQLLNLPESTVRGRLERARVVLRKELRAMCRNSELSWDLDSRDLHALRAAANSADTDPERLVLTCLFFSDGHLVSTDGHRLFHYAAPSLAEIPRLLAGANLGRELRDRFPQAHSARLSFSEQEVLLRLPDGAEIRAPRVHEQLTEPVVQYPKFDRLMIDKWKLSVTAGVADWLESLTIIANLREQGVIPRPATEREVWERVLIILSPETERITLRAGQFPEASQSITREVSLAFAGSFCGINEEFIFAADARYITHAIQALRAVPGSLVEPLRLS